MKKLLFILFFLLTLITFSDAKDCQYYDTETYYQLEDYLCMKNSQIVKGKALELTDFQDGEAVMFVAYNPNDYEVSVTFLFNVTGYLEGQLDLGTKISPKEHKQVRKWCFDFDKKHADETVIVGNCTLDRRTVTYTISRPKPLEPCQIKVKREKEVCEKKCSSNSDCESTVCNINGYCSKERIVLCSEPSRNCNDLYCIVPGVKIQGKAYNCDWECESIAGEDGFCKTKDNNLCLSDIECLSGHCNFLGLCGEAVCLNGAQNCKDMECRTPSVLKSGEAYLCEWECESGVGKDGVCKEKLFNEVKSWFFLVIGFIFFAVVLIYFLIYVKKKKLDVLIIEIKLLNSKIDKLQTEINDHEEKVRKNKEEIKRLQEEADNAKGRAKEILEFEISKLMNENKELKQLIDENEDKIVKVNKIVQKIKDNYVQCFDKYYDDLKIRYGRDKIKIDGEGYPVFKDSNKKIHIYVYDTEYKIAYHKERDKTYHKEQDKNRIIHHIDRIKSNANFWNLIDLTRKEHRNIEHSRIIPGDWGSGIKELKKALNWSDDDLPKHIKNHFISQKTNNYKKNYRNKRRFKRKRR